MWTVLPLNVQLLSPLECRPGVVRQHGHTAQRLKPVRRLERINRRGLLYARDAECILILERFDRPAQHGRMRHRGVKHSVHVRVLAENSLAGAKRHDVVTLHRLSDVAPSVPRLELQLFLLRYR